MSVRVKSSVISCFKMHGLSLRSDATKYLSEILSTLNEREQEDWLERIVETVRKQPLTSALLKKDLIEAAVEECKQGDDDENDNVFNIISSFSLPRFTFNQEQKKFLRDSKPVNLHGNADVKTALFLDRYTLLHQRTSRHNLFTPPVQGSTLDSKTTKFQLKSVEFLLGSTAKIGELIVLGMLTQIKEGKYFLEDPTGAVELDLSKAQFHKGFFTENSFVLAEGWYEDEVFHVNGLGFPPPEPADVSRSFFGSLNFFGGPLPTCAKSSAKLAALEESNQDAMFVLLSDIWLDQVRVREKLATLFLGYSEMPPTCFIFCGNFSSAPYGHNHIKTLQESFKLLADMICEHPYLAENSKFVFVPGPQDPGPASILPRPPIPACITDYITQRVPSAVFTTNPCRIQYCSQEIVVFREDIIMKMCRNSIKFPDSRTEIPKNFMKSVVCQAHLSPLPLHVSPVYWSYDNALRIYPLPDLIVFGDKYDPYTVTTAGCIGTNTGSFSKNSYSFKVYYPSNKTVEDSQIED
ncbi:DNA polymerase epsilon subunit 2-like isoform X1 [Apostichopus japonicus]|uniref:DNA polymerase epsilon subunit 2-like isoform X1 n=1 Tax=Stichopus japonicus TaxID=307972 RepID=UPI003AB40C72